MALRTLLIILMAWALFPPSEARDGREGNEFYTQSQFEQAIEAYERGLDKQEEPNAYTARLWTNLGLAAYELDQLDRALDAFERATDTAESDHDRAQAAYNAGNVLAVQGQVDAALDHYRDALRHEPGHERARFNYEFLQREGEAEVSPDRQPTPDDIEPSPFAEQLKARADSLTREQQYGEALRLMTDGLEQDSTVAAYREFMQRLDAVARIDEDDEPLPN